MWGSQLWLVGWQQLGFGRFLITLGGGGKVNVGFVLKLQEGLVVGIIGLAVLGLVF